MTAVAPVHWTRRLGDFLRYAILAMVLVVPSYLGAGMAYFALVTALVFALIHLPWRPARLRPERAGLMLLVAYAIYLGVTAIVALVNDRPAELSFALNFLALALFVPLLALLAGGARPGNARLVATLALAGSLLCLVLALAETSLMRVPRAGVTTGDVIRFGATALILGFIALIGLSEARSAWRWLYLLGPLAGLVTVLLSGSRGPLVAVPFMAAAAALLLIPRWRVALLVLAVTGAACLVLLLAAEALGFARIGTLIEIAAQVLQGEVVGDTSTNIRFNIYSAGIAAFQESPWIGHGWSQITIAPQPWFEDKLPLTAYSHLHNDPLDFLVAVGLPGLVCYALIIAAPIAGALASPRDSQRRMRLYGATILCLAYGIGGQFSLMLGFEYQTGLYVALAAIMLGYCRDVPPTAAGA